MKNSKTLLMVELALFTAIEIIFCFTPLGSLPIGPGIVATLAHIPAIVCALTLGVVPAAYMGAVMGISSLIIWSAMPPNPAIAFVFSPFVPGGNITSLIICVVPRIVFPILTAVVYDWLKRRNNSRIAKNATRTVIAAISAVAGTFLHSAMVLSLIYFAFKNTSVIDADFINFITAWAGLNAVFEIIIAGVVSAAIIIPLEKIKVRMR